MNKQLRLFIRHTDVSPDGRVLKVHPWRPANTLLRNFAALLLIFFSQVTQSVKDWANADHDDIPRSDNFAVNAALSNTTYGILIGTGETAVTRTDYKLATQVTTDITHSTLSYELLNPTTDDWHILLHRSFTNNTGAAIDVKEVALVAKNANTYIYCLDRTLYNVTLGIGVTKIITYKIQI